MDRRLIPVNAVIGMLTPGTGWPTPLKEAGYALAALEVPIRGLAGDVVIDAVAVNRTANDLLAAECKGGRNVEAEQARRYDALPAEPDAVVRAANVSLPTAGSRSLDTVFVCLSEHVLRVKVGLEAAGAPQPILAVGQQVSHHGEPFRHEALRTAFTRPHDTDGPPPAIIQVDAGSPDETFDRLVTAELVAAMAHRKVNVTIRAVTEGVVRHWSIYGAAARGQLQRRVEASARRVCEHDPDRFLYRPPSERSHEPSVDIIATPEDADPRGRTQAYQVVGRRLPQAARRVKREIEGQERFHLDDLVSDLDEADHLEEGP